MRLLFNLKCGCIAEKPQTLEWDITCKSLLIQAKNDCLLTKICCIFKFTIVAISMFQPKKKKMLLLVGKF